MFDPIRRALVRYFSPADTQAPPKNSQAANPQLAALIEQLQGFNEQARVMLSGQKLADAALTADPNALGNPVSPDDIKDSLLAQIKEQFPFANVTVIDRRRPEPDQDADRPGIKPPDPMPFDMWRKMIDEMDLQPGWSPCMIGNRRGVEGRAAFVYGMARGLCGIYSMPFEVCNCDDDEDDDRQERILAALTHLPTGISLGVFENTKVAMMAADLLFSVASHERLMNMDPDEAFGPNGFMSMLKPIQTAWEFGSIRPSEKMHAHDGHSPALAIWCLDPSVDADKPSVLS